MLHRHNRGNRKNRTKPQRILIGAGVGVCNRKTALRRKPYRTSPITPLVCYTCMLMLYAQGRSQEFILGWAGISSK